MSASDGWEPRAGEMHPVDQAFYNLTVKERDFERVKNDRMYDEMCSLRQQVKNFDSIVGEVRATMEIMRLEHDIAVDQTTRLKTENEALARSVECLRQASADAIDVN